METHIITQSWSYSDCAVWFGNDQLDEARKYLLPYLRQNDTLIGTGMSGSLVVPRLAEALGMEWAVVRKKGVRSHSDMPMEGTRFTNRWVFVDDFMSSGDTFRNTLRGVHDWAVSRNVEGAQIIGAWLYNNAGGTSNWLSREALVQKYTPDVSWRSPIRDEITALIKGKDYEPEKTEAGSFY